MCGIPDLTCLIFRQRAVSLYEYEINKLTTGHNRFCRLGADECGKDVSSYYYYHHLHIKRFNCNYILMLIEICNICQLVLTYHLLHVSGCNYLKRLAQYLVIYRMKSGNVLLFTQWSFLHPIVDVEFKTFFYSQTHKFQQHSKMPSLFPSTCTFSLSCSLSSAYLTPVVLWVFLKPAWLTP